MPGKIKVLLVGDTRGHDDEAMKKTARTLANKFQDIQKISASVVSSRQSINSVEGADIFHYIGGPSYRSVLLAAFVKKKNRKLRTILTFTNPFWGAFSNLCIRFFPPDHVIVMSEFWQNWAKSAGLSNSYLSLSGVQLSRFTPLAEPDRTKLRRRLNFPENKIIVLHVGHLKDDRNLGVLVEVQKREEFHVVVVGSTTTTQSGDLISKLESFGIYVVAGYQTNIEEYYQAADCYVFPTVDTRAAIQVPLSVLEAMATGSPVVTTPFGGLPVLFPETKSYRYLPEGKFSGGEIVSLVRSTASNASRAEIRARVEIYSWEKIAENLSLLYELMLSKNGNPHAR